MVIGEEIYDHHAQGKPERKTNTFKVLGSSGRTFDSTASFAETLEYVGPGYAREYVGPREVSGSAVLMPSLKDKPPRRPWRISSASHVED